MSNVSLIDGHIDEMIDNDIIKALECCKKDDCDNCPNNFGSCYANLSGYALDLINRQKSENERLKECPKCIYEYDGKTTEYCVQGPCSNFKTVEQIKSEAYKEFAEHLKERWSNNYYDSPDVDFDEFVDNLLKEMEDED